MYRLNISRFCFGFHVLSLFSLMILALPPSSPTKNLIAAHRFANLSSPVPGQILYAGRPFSIRYDNQLCTANATQVSLFNASGLFLVASNISFSHHRTDTDIFLPSWVGNGTYNFVLRENDSGGSGSYQDVVFMTIYVGKRPPAGIGSGETQDSTPPPPSVHQQPLSQVKPCQHPLISREPHPPRFDQPVNGSTFSPGSIVPILYRDGETSADQVQFVLKSLYTGRHYILGNMSFTFFAKTQFRLPNSTREGPYQIWARENSPDNKDSFTNVLSVNFHVSKPSSPAKNTLPDSYQLKHEPSSPTPRDRAPITESPTILSPAPAEVVSLGSTIECKIHASWATNETVKFGLRSARGRYYPLGQAIFMDHFAGGHFDLPSQVPTGTYSVMVRQNSVARPYRFLNVVSTTIFITNKDRVGHDQSETQFFQHIEAIQLSRSQAMSTSGPSLIDVDYISPLEQAAASTPTLNKLPRSTNHQLVRREPHLPYFKSPVSRQVIPTGDRFPCQFIDGEVSYEKVKFVLRQPQQKSQVLFSLAEVGFNSSLASLTCSIPSSLTPGLYELVAQENTLSEPETYSDVASVDIIVTSSVKYSKQSYSTRALIRLATREPHPAMLISPVESQTIVAGETFECHLRDGETTATLVRFSLRSEAGKETVLGQTSFSNYQALSSFRCPEHLAKGAYAFIVEENSSSDPDDFEESLKIHVNVVDKNSTVPPALVPSKTNSTSVAKPASNSSTSSSASSSVTATTSGNSHVNPIVAPIPTKKQQDDPNNGTTAISQSSSGNLDDQHNSNGSVFIPSAGASSSRTSSLRHNLIFHRNRSKKWSNFLNFFFKMHFFSACFYMYVFT